MQPLDDRKTWKKGITYTHVIPEKKNRIIGLSFPKQDKNLGLEPSILTVLPDGDNVEYSYDNIDFDDSDVLYYACSVYISGYNEFKEWSNRHNKNKIIVGGYHPTTFPEQFVNFANKIVIGMCDNFYETIKQEGQIVNGIVDYNKIPRYDLYDIKYNQQVIPNKKQNELCTSINTSYGCPFKCDFCCSPLMCPTLMSKPISLIEKEIQYIKNRYSDNLPSYIFIRDENFPLQPDWKERLIAVEKLGAKIYLFASANLLKEEDVKFMSEHNVYMICLGLEDITVTYAKNVKLIEVCKLLKKYKIYIYLSFIVNPLKIIGQEAAINFYTLLFDRINEICPEMICGNFLMPFRGTKVWDEYYAFVSEEDYNSYDSKSAFLIKNKVLRQKMEFFMFWYQYKYYLSDEYKNVRDFNCNDMLQLRFIELYDKLMPKYNAIKNTRC